jgi:hypothetical protein
MAILLFVAISIETRAQSRSSPNTPAPKIPATSGIVVDALTDRPVGGIDVVLRASLAEDEPLRYQNSTTSADGRFRFPARPEPRAAGFLSGIKEISLSVNRVFVSVAQMRALNPLESRRTSDGPSDVTWLAQHGTLGDYNHTNNPNSEFQPGRLDNRSYFPVSGVRSVPPRLQLRMVRDLSQPVAKREPAHLLNSSSQRPGRLRQDCRP